VGIRAGFAGQFKVGAWAPFEVTLAAGSHAARGHVQLTLADGDGVPSRVHAPPGEPITVRAGEKSTVRLLAKIGQLKSDVVVGFRGTDGSLITRRFSTAEHAELSGIMPAGSQLVVTLGTPLIESDRANLERRNTRVAELDSLEQLPTEWWGLESVDAVVLGTPDERVGAPFASDSPQLAALDEWTRMGGTLILSVGRNATSALASGSPLAKLAPARPESMVPLREGTALETYAETTEPIAAGGRFSLEVPKLVEVRGKIEAYAGSAARDLPLVVRAPHGFGEVVLVAVDLDQPLLADWPGRGQFLDKLLGPSVQGAQAADSGTLGQVTTLGFVDLAGQLRGALDQFTGVRLVPFWLVAVLVVAYIACIGPLDYFLVKRVLGRMEATWVTFAITVVAFSAGAYLLAYQLKGRELRVNRVDLVDFDVETNLVRGTSWATLMSPRSETYDLSIDPQGAVARPSVPPRTVFSWLGLPGDGFGGMNPSTASLPLFTVPYEFSGRLDRLVGVPVAVWSTKAFVGRWWAGAAAPIEADLADGGRLTGTLASRLDAPLEDSVLIYDTWAYPLRTFAPGQTIDVAAQLDPQTVETYLRRVTVRGDRDVAPPYDRASFDIPRIVEVMSCHELAGGENYTALAAEFQEYVDLSQLVGNGRAVLIGRQPKTATRLVSDGDSLDDPAGSRWTFYRFVFPVKLQARP
jgi:hypothetical protein